MRMDHFGFYAVDGFAGTPIPFVLTLLVNLLLAVAAGLMYDFLYAWQVSRGTTNPYKRAAWVLIPPIAFVYICMLFISCAGTWLYLLEALPVLAGVLMAVTVLRDESVKITTWSKRFLLQTSVIVTVVLTAISLAGMVAVYLDPSLQFVADHTLIRSWEVDFNALGYPPEELVDRSRISTVWSCLAAIVYMVVVVGGSLFVTIVKKDTEDSASPATAPAAQAPLPVSQKRRSRRSKVDTRYRPVWLTKHRFLRPTQSNAKFMQH